MKTQNLKFTSTIAMTNEEWHLFRQPVHHISKWIDEFLIDNEPMRYSYDWLKELFESESWDKFHFPCLGSSDVGTIMGLNPYQSVIELFYTKVGLKEYVQTDNLAMFWGRELEKEIASKWQYWEGTPESMIENFTKDKIIRRCRRINAYVQNIERPWLFISVDRIINKKHANWEGILECKTISGWAADQWENGFPPMYVVQIQAQLGTFEMEWGECAILRDGRGFEVLPFSFNQGIFEGICIRTEIFYKRVKEAVKHFILAKYAGDTQLRLDHISQIHNLSPEPDGSIAYENYLKENTQDRGLEINGTDEHWNWICSHQDHKKGIEEMETKQREFSNKIKKVLGDAEASKLSFGTKGFVSWKADSRGIRKFLVKVKYEANVPVDSELATR